MQGLANGTASALVVAQHAFGLSSVTVIRNFMCWYLITWYYNPMGPHERLPYKTMLYKLRETTCLLVDRRHDTSTKSGCGKQCSCILLLGSTITVLTAEQYA